jgi:hypothetical protein
MQKTDNIIENQDVATMSWPQYLNLNRKEVGFKM